MTSSEGGVATKSAGDATHCSSQPGTPARSAISCNENPSKSINAARPAKLSERRSSADCWRDVDVLAPEPGGHDPVVACYWDRRTNTFTTSKARSTSRFVNCLRIPSWPWISSAVFPRDQVIQYLALCPCPA